MQALICQSSLCKTLQTESVGKRQLELLIMLPLFPAPLAFVHSLSGEVTHFLEVTPLNLLRRKIRVNTCKYVSKERTSTVPNVAEEEQQCEDRMSICEPATRTRTEYAVRIQRFTVKFKGLPKLRFTGVTLNCGSIFNMLSV